MTTTAGDQINGALRLIGQLAEGETPSAATSQDALTAFNQMLDSWSTEKLSIFTTQEQIYIWPAGFLTKSLGPTGDFIGNRPITMDDATVTALSTKRVTIYNLLTSFFWQSFSPFPANVHALLCVNGRDILHK